MVVLGMIYEVLLLLKIFELLVEHLHRLLGQIEFQRAEAKVGNNSLGNITWKRHVILGHHFELGNIACDFETLFIRKQNYLFACWKQKMRLHDIVLRCA